MVVIHVVCVCVCVCCLLPLSGILHQKKDLIFLGRQGVISFLAREAAIAVSLFYSSGKGHSEVSFTLFLD